MLQSLIGEQNSSIEGLLRDNGGSLHKGCVSFTQKESLKKRKTQL